MLAFRLAWRYAWAYLLPSRTGAPLVRKVRAFNASQHAGQGYVEFFRRDADLAECVAHLRRLGWTTFAVHVHYELGGSKYRAVYRFCDDGEDVAALAAVTFPPPRKRPGPSARRPAVAGARLTRHDGGAPLDVTLHVRKFHGPDRDFHAVATAAKRGLGVHDLFPWSCHDVDALTYDALTLDMSDGTSRTLGPYAANPSLVHQNLSNSSASKDSSPPTTLPGAARPRDAVAAHASAAPTSEPSAARRAKVGNAATLSSRILS